MHLVEGVDGVEQVDGRREDVDHGHATGVERTAVGGRERAEDLRRQDPRPLDPLGGQGGGDGRLQLRVAGGEPPDRLGPVGGDRAIVDHLDGGGGVLEVDGQHRAVEQGPLALQEGPDPGAPGHVPAVEQEEEVVGSVLGGDGGPRPGLRQHQGDAGAVLDRRGPGHVVVRADDDPLVVAGRARQGADDVVGVAGAGAAVDLDAPPDGTGGEQGQQPGPVGAIDPGRRQGPVLAVVGHVVVPGRPGHADQGPHVGGGAGGDGVVDLAPEPGPEREEVVGHRTRVVDRGGDGVHELGRERHQVEGVDGDGAPGALGLRVVAVEADDVGLEPVGPARAGGEGQREALDHDRVTGTTGGPDGEAGRPVLPRGHVDAAQPHVEPGGPQLVGDPALDGLAGGAAGSADAEGAGLLDPRHETVLGGEGGEDLVDRGHVSSGCCRRRPGPGGGSPRSG